MKITKFLCFISLLSGYSSVYSATVLYDQDFENPASFVNNAGDVNIFNDVNSLYGDQPDGFTFAQKFTVETLLVTGNQAFGTGYSDPAGTAGNYAIGMLANYQNDLLGLSFDIGTNNFLNTSIDLSSIDLSVFSGPFVPDGAIPTFEFTLFDNPFGITTTGGGTILDSIQVDAPASAKSVFDWTNVILPLDATGNTNGNVTLRIDLIDGGYGAMDNLIIAASDIAGDIGTPTQPPAAVSETTSLLLFGIGMLFPFISRRKKNYGQTRE